MLVYNEEELITCIYIFDYMNLNTMICFQYNKLGVSLTFKREDTHTLAFK